MACVISYKGKDTKVMNIESARILLPLAEAQEVRLAVFAVESFQIIDIGGHRATEPQEVRLPLAETQELGVAV